MALLLLGIGGAIATVVGVGGTVAHNVVKTTDARSDALREEKKPFKWDIDEDDHKRGCTVQCYKRKVFGLNNHWALTFNWGDHVATYEADNDGGYLIPRWKKGRQEFQSPSGERYEWEASVTFEIDSSPRDVNDKARAVPYNGAKYVLTKINGHLWTEYLARDLGFKHWKLSATDEMFIPSPIASIIDGCTFP